MAYVASPMRTCPSLVAAPRRLALTRCRRVVSRCSAADLPAQPPVSNPIIRLAAAASSMLHRGVQGLAACAVEAARQTDEAAVNQQIKDSLKSMRVLALVAPFAAVSGSADTFFIITKAVASFIKVGAPACV